MLGDLEAGKEIDKRVDRLLRDADAYGRFPTPVDDIVAAAKLTQTDDYVLDESRIAKAPAYLRAALRSAKQKIQGWVDRRERIVQISPHIEHESKRRFVKLHETTHDILPHQQDLVYADTNETLSLKTKRLFEQEANQGAAELLFQRKHFKRDANDHELGLDAVWLLANRYGSSFHAALRRYAESHDAAVAAIVFDPSPIQLTPRTWRRAEAMATATWRARFGPLTWPNRLDSVTYPFTAALDYPVNDVQFVDLAGEKVTVRVASTSNTYKRFLLLWIPQQRRIRKPLRVRTITQPDAAPRSR